MADNSYVIDVNIDINNNGGGIVRDAFDTVYDGSNKGGNAVKGGYKNALKAGAAIGAVAASIFGYKIGTVYARQGDSYRQEQVNYSMSMIAKGAGLITAFAVAGPIGGIAAIAMETVNLYKKIDTYNYNTRIENIGLEQTRARAGAQINRSRHEQRQ